jgi:hypothetical protein
MARMASPAFRNVNTSWRILGRKRQERGKKDRKRWRKWWRRGNGRNSSQRRMIIFEKVEKL